MIDKDSILEYPALDADARRALERAVRAEGRHVVLLEEMIILARMMDEASVRDVGADELAFVVAQECSEDVKSPFADAIEELAAGDQKLEEDLETMRQRAAGFLESHDPLTHFESLRGESLRGESAQAGRHDVKRDDINRPITRRDPAADASDAPDANPMVREHQDRYPVGRSGLRLVVPQWWSVAAALVVAALIGVFTLSVVSTESDFARLGHFEVDEINPDRYLMTARSADSFSLTPTDSVLVQALGLLRDARSVRLGIFPHYDRGELTEAAVLLSEVIARLPENDFVSLEARYLRAKTNLLLDDPRATMQDLEVLLQYEGTRNARARGLMADVRAVMEDG